MPKTITIITVAFRSYAGVARKVFTVMCPSVITSTIGRTKENADISMFSFDVTMLWHITASTFHTMRQE